MKLDKNLIPLPAIIFLLVVYVFSQGVELVFTYYNLKEHSHFSNYELPIAEKNNLSTSLNARLGRLLYQTIIYKDANTLLEFKRSRQELAKHIDEVNNLMLNSRMQSFKWLDRSEFERIENKIVYLIESGKYDEALKVLNGNDYAQATSIFFTQLESVGTQLKKKQKEQAEDTYIIIWVNIGFSFLFAVSTLYIGFSIYRKYTHNIKLFEMSEENTEKQRVINIRNAKLAELGEMAGMISHEINNPLSIIQGNILRIKRLLSQEPIDNEKIMNSIESAQNTIKRIVNIISGLQKFSRDSANDGFEEVSVKKIINETIEFCSFRLNKYNINVSMDNVTDQEIYCNSVEISQIILNLLNNSIDAISDLPDRWIDISAYARGSEICISVKDSGGGISEEIRDKIFQNYFTTKDKDKGTGIGLNISKILAERHSGNLVYDKLSQNTKFDIILPIKKN